MPRFTLRAALLGMTLAAIGFGMLAIAFHGKPQQPPTAISLSDAILVALGGTFVGYGCAFPFKWPPHQMVLGMIGMFAAQAWQAGSSFGLLVYLGLLPLLGLHYWLQKRWAKRDGPERT